MGGIFPLGESESPQSALAGLLRTRMGRLIAVANDSGCVGKVGTINARVWYG